MLHANHIIQKLGINELNTNIETQQIITFDHQYRYVKRTKYSPSKPGVRKWFLVRAVVDVCSGSFYCGDRRLLDKCSCITNDVLPLGVLWY